VAARAGGVALVAVAAGVSPAVVQAKVSRPVIRRLFPTSASALGGQRITILGRGFTRVSAVTFGTRPGRSVQVLSSDKLTVVTPRHAAGSVEVRVATQNGRSSASRAARVRFTPIPPPALDRTPPGVAAAPLPTPIVPDGAGPNPTSNCTGGLDYCGAEMEGLAPAPLPSNWSELSNTAQAFVLLNLERIERGEDPLLAESATLDAYAAQGAATGQDPYGPLEESGNWASVPDSVAAITDYLYDDGPDSGNLTCTSTQIWGCWGHRDNILNSPDDPILAVGLADGADGSAEAFSDEVSDYTFTWAQELAAGYPQGLPASSTLTSATVTVARPVTDEHSVIVLGGVALDTASAFYFGDLKAPAGSNCDPTGDSCTINIPRVLQANTTYTIYARNRAGLSAANSAATYTTAP
jgi:hypothetical protein